MQRQIYICLQKHAHIITAMNIQVFRSCWQMCSKLKISIIHFKIGSLKLKMSYCQSISCSHLQLFSNLFMQYLREHLHWRKRISYFFSFAIFFIGVLRGTNDKLCVMTQILSLTYLHQSLSHDSTKHNLSFLHHCDFYQTLITVQFPQLHRLKIFHGNSCIL